jgi:hypothetical protein
VLRLPISILRSCSVPESDTLRVMPNDLPGVAPYSPGWCVSVAVICWCRIGEEDDNEKEWEVLWNVYLAISHIKIIKCHVAHFTPVTSCCI